MELYRENEFIRLPVSAVFDYLEEKKGEIPGTENSLRNFIRYLNETGELVFSEKKRVYTKVPKQPYGKQLQIDFGEIKQKNGLKMYIFGAVLSSSRFKYATLQNRPFKTEDVIEHLYTKKFNDFKNEMGFFMWVCRAGDPESKGKIENLIKYIHTGADSQ